MKNLLNLIPLCTLGLHSWGQWVDMGLYDVYSGKSKYVTKTFIVQRRYCQECNKSQVRRVRRASIF